MKILTIGDLHLEALENSLGAGSDKYIYQQLDIILNYARKEGITKVVQLGDVFHNPNPNQETIKGLIEYLYNNKDLEWHIILGNHDFGTNKQNSLEVCHFLSLNNLLPSVHVYTELTHRVIEGIDLFFAPWPFFKKFDYLEGKPCLCFGHLEVTGAITDSGQVIKGGISRDSLREEDFWLMGHLHRRQDYKQVHYPGTILQYNFGEPLPKGFSIIDVALKKEGESSRSSSLATSILHIPLSTPYEFKNIRVRSQEDFAQVDLSNSRVHYKVFLEVGGLTVPRSFLNGTAKNVHKVINNIPKVEAVVDLGQIVREGEVEECTMSLSEDFISSSRELFFEPLEGIDDYLRRQSLAEEEVCRAKSLIEGYRLEYVRAR